MPEAKDGFNSGDEVTTPYRTVELPIEARQRDIRMVADKFRWMINQHCPSGIDRTLIHVALNNVVSCAEILSATWKTEVKEGLD